MQQHRFKSKLSVYKTIVSEALSWPRKTQKLTEWVYCSDFRHSCIHQALQELDTSRSPSILLCLHNRKQQCLKLCMKIQVTKLSAADRQLTKLTPSFVHQCLKVTPNHRNWQNGHKICSWCCEWRGLEWPCSILAVPDVDILAVVHSMFWIHSPDGTNVLWFKRCGVWGDRVRVGGWKLWNPVPSPGHFLFTCWDTLTVGCTV